MAEDKHILVTLNGTPAGLCGATKAAMFVSFYSNSRIIFLPQLPPGKIALFRKHGWLLSALSESFVHSLTFSSTTEVDKQSSRNLGGIYHWWVQCPQLCAGVFTSLTHPIQQLYLKSLCSLARLLHVCVKWQFEFSKKKKLRYPFMCPYWT